MIDQKTFEIRIRRFSRVRRGLLNATLAYRLARFALWAGVAALLLLSGWLPNAFVNMGLFAALALFLLGLAVTCLIKRTRFRSYLDEAFHLERLAGNLNSRIVSAWDFLASNFITPLTRAVIARARDDLRHDHEAQVDRSERNRQRKHFLAWLVVFLAIGFTPWFGFARMADNFERSWAELRNALFPVEYALLPGEGTHVYRLGEAVEIALQFKQRGHPLVRLIGRIGVETKTTELAVNAEGRARHTITSDVEAEHVLHFEFGDQRTADVTLIFTTPPSLVHMQTELLYPAYTRLLPRSLEGVQQRLLGLPGTRITLGFTFSKELESAVITWDDDQKLPLETVGRYATVSLLHNRARQASLQVRDIHGFAMDAPLLIDFEVQIDEKPLLFLPRHLKEDMPMLEGAAKLFGFGVVAQDDFGITRLVLKWQKSAVDNSTAVLERGEVERLISPVQRKVVVSFEKVFAAMNLQPGDKISFQVEAWDNRVPDRQVTVSRRCSFFIYQEGLAGLTIKELGFGGGAEFNRQRIAKSTRATAVKEPEGLRTREGVRNEFEASVTSGTRAPTVRGEHGQATRDYFRLLANVKYPDEKSSSPKEKRD